MRCPIDIAEVRSGKWQRHRRSSMYQAQPRRAGRMPRNDMYEPGCDLDAREDMLMNFNEYMAGGFGDDYPERWKPVFAELQDVGPNNPILLSLVERWKQPGK